jgi:threonine dehydrogenase-like Zn-dependent dehydrogenase
VWTLRRDLPRLAGGRTIIACHLDDNKLVYAKTFGGTHTINARLGDVVKQVHVLTGGLGVDAVSAFTSRFLPAPVLPAPLLAFDR